MNTREQAIAYISGAIATYSLRKERGELEDQASMYDFLAKTIPNDLESEAKIELIDEIFQYVATRESREYIQKANQIRKITLDKHCHFRVTLFFTSFERCKR